MATIDDLIDCAQEGESADENPENTAPVAARPAEQSFPPKAVEAQPLVHAGISDEEFEARKVEFARTCPDFDETVESVCDCVVFPHIAEFIRTSTYGVQVGYHLAKNRQLLSMIHDLDRAAALEELRNLEATMAADGERATQATAKSSAVRLDHLGIPKDRASGAMPSFALADDQELRRRISRFAEAVPDYYQVLDHCPWRVPAHVEQYLRSSKDGPRLGYYLGKHWNLYARIIETSPTYAIARLISLERQLAHHVLMARPDLYSVEYTLTPTEDDLQVATQILRLFGWNHQDANCMN